MEMSNETCPCEPAHVVIWYPEVWRCAGAGGWTLAALLFSLPFSKCNTPRQEFLNKVQLTFITRWARKGAEWHFLCEPSLCKVYLAHQAHAPRRFTLVSKKQSRSRECFSSCYLKRRRVLWFNGELPSAHFHAKNLPNLHGEGISNP